MSGRKQVFGCAACGGHRVVAFGSPPPACCGTVVHSLLSPLVESGRVVRPAADVHAVRRAVLAGLADVAL
jgi:hypothetical protein